MKGFAIRLMCFTLAMSSWVKAQVPLPNGTCNVTCDAKIADFDANSVSL